MEFLALCAPYAFGFLFLVFCAIVGFKIAYFKRDKKLKAEFEEKQKNDGLHISAE